MFTIRQKQTLIVWAVTGVLILGIIGLAFEYWFVTVPALAVLVGTVILTARARRQP